MPIVVLLTISFPLLLEQIEFSELISSANITMIHAKFIIKVFAVSFTGRLMPHTESNIEETKAVLDKTDEANKALNWF